MVRILVVHVFSFPKIGSQAQAEANRRLDDYLAVLA
jgi:hypothetical protein